jgi:hypothetical protein
MNNEINDGGAAFPQRPFETSQGLEWPNSYGESGLSARDYFAAKAMQGLYANPTWLEAISECSKDVTEQSNSTARAAYRMADAMLRAREEKG